MSERKLLTGAEFANHFLQRIGDERPHTWGKRNGINRGVIDKLSKGKIPDPHNLLLIADALGVSIDWLLTGRKGLRTKSTDVNAPRSAKEKEYLDKLLLLLPNPATKKVIKENIDTFLKVPKPSLKKNEVT